MKFEGTVGTSELPDIFHLLSTSGRLGALVVTQGRRQRRVFFTSEGITLPFDTEQSNRLLGQILLARGTITEAQLHSALERQRAAKLPVGEILVNAGAAKMEEVNDALAYQLREELFELLTWEKATFEFEEHATPPTGGRSYVRTPMFNPDAIMMEAARRADEWKRIREAIPSEHAVPLRTEPAGTSPQASAQAGPFDEECASATREVLSLADGTCSIGEMHRILGRSPYETFEGVYAAQTSGALKLATARELAELASEALKAHEAERARQILVHAADLAGDDLELRYDLGLLCLWAGVEKEAAEHLDFVLGRLVEEELSEKIDEMLDGVREQFPDSPYSYERRMKLLHLATDLGKALPLAERLLAIYDRAHNVETATKMFRYLKRFAATTPELAQRLGGLMESRGDLAAAAQQYYVAARQARFTGGTHEAIRLCEKAVRLNAQHADARAWLEELLAEPRRRVRQGMLGSVLGMALFAGIVLGSYYVARERAASDALSRADALSARMLAQNDFDAASRAYDVLAREFAGTTLGPVMAKRLEAVEADREAFVSGRAVTVQMLRREAEGAADAGDFDRASASYERLVELALTKKPAAEARAAIDALRVERTAFDAQMARARSHEAAGRYEDAVAAYAAARRASERLFRHARVTLPLSIESLPAGAEVLVGGRAVGRAPQVVRRPGDAPAELTLRLNGYNDVMLRLDASSPQGAVRATLVPTRATLASLDLGADLAGAPAAIGSTAAFVTKGGSLLLWDAAAGRSPINVRLAEEMGTLLGPLSAADRFLVASPDGRLRAFSRTSGKELYRTPPGGMMSAAAAVERETGRVVLAHVGGKVEWIDPADGRASDAGKLPVSPLGEVCPVGGWLVFASDGRSVLAYDPKKDRVAWTYRAERPVSRGMATLPEAVLVRLEDREILALSIDEGRVLWRWSAPQERVEAPVAAGRRVYVASAPTGSRIPGEEGWMTALDAESGRVLWRTPLGAAPAVPCSADDSGVWVATVDGGLAALRGSDGAVAWKTRLSAPAVWPPMPAGNRLVVVTQDRKASAFAK